MPFRAVSNHVASKPPEFVTETDTSIEYDGITQDVYVFKKTVDFGIQKVVWVFSATNMVMIAKPNVPWQIYPWNTTLSLTDGITFNIETYFRENDLDNLLNF